MNPVPHCHKSHELQLVTSEKETSSRLGLPLLASTTFMFTKPLTLINSQTSSMMQNRVPDWHVMLCVIVSDVALRQMPFSISLDWLCRKGLILAKCCLYYVTYFYSIIFCLSDTEFLMATFQNMKAWGIKMPLESYHLQDLNIP